ncbi:unnamed protein product [Caenorhabditis auriculariae]|uniref:Sulfotransferase domain-containing protein n=1 Tax=Caenorhabditis auriculariae TaxID=2777116 RepID=A0A8S1H533_9PELO|nr:unnamed protein product [Caenorhabditis auriculariae]
MTINTFLGKLTHLLIFNAFVQASKNRFHFLEGSKLDKARIVNPFVDYDQHFQTADLYNLAICQIPGSMSTTNAGVFCYLHAAKRFLANNQSINSHGGSMCEKENFVRGIDSLGDKSLLALVRDPLERFVSAYVDKCIRKVCPSLLTHTFKLLVVKEPCVMDARKTLTVLSSASIFV